MAVPLTMETFINQLRANMSAIKPTYPSDLNEDPPPFIEDVFPYSGPIELVEVGSGINDGIRLFHVLYGPNAYPHRPQGKTSVTYEQDFSISVRYDIPDADGGYGRLNAFIGMDTTQLALAIRASYSGGFQDYRFINSLPVRHTSEKTVCTWFYTIKFIQTVRTTIP